MLLTIGGHCEIYYLLEWMSTKIRLVYALVIGYTGEIVSESAFASDVKLVIKFIETLKSRYENDVEIKCGYEAGCLGYSLYKSVNCKRN